MKAQSCGDRVTGHVCRAGGCPRGHVCHGRLGFRVPEQHRVMEPQLHPIFHGLPGAGFSSLLHPTQPRHKEKAQSSREALQPTPNFQPVCTDGAHRPFLSAALTSAPSWSSRWRHGSRSGSSLARSRGLLSWICTEQEKTKHYSALKAIYEIWRAAAGASSWPTEEHI